MSAEGQAQWLRAREKGGVIGIRFLIFIATFGGRTLVRLLMWPVALYYAVAARSARRGLAVYYVRLEGKAPTFRRLFGHFRRFANVAVDRFFLVKARFDLFEFSETGKHHLLELQAKKQGAILLGCHLGSFEAMRSLSRDCKLPLNVVGYFRNARAFNEALEKYDPDCNVKLIEIDPSGVSFVFNIKQCIDRGELVAILGDRVGLTGHIVTADFLGAPARFSGGIYAMASVLACPVYFTAALYKEPHRYDLFCELFAERISLPRKDRVGAMTEYAQRFADRMEHYCRLAPDNWFNFYDFWAGTEAAEKATKVAA